MKKFSIKLILCSLIITLSIICGSFFVVKEKTDNYLSTSFYGYNDSYITNTDDSHLIEIDLNQNLNASIPSSYDLRDYIEIKVENQKTYGICYAFGSLTMLETYLALKYNEYYDFSEIHMATSKYVDNGAIVTDSLGNIVDSNVDFDSAYGGGNFFNFYDYCLKDSGPVLEIEMPMSTFYSSYNVEEIEDKAETYYKTYKSEFSNLVTVNQFVSFLDGSSLSQTDKITNRKNIKQHIISNGSCSASIYSTSMGIYNNTQYLNSVNQSPNHMISIIGWDDNYKPNDWTNAGAYLCLNSWGEDEYGGVFYVSYDDPNIETDVYGISDAELNSTNNIISNYEAFLTNSSSLSRTSSWNVISEGTSFVGTVTDVSDKLNSYINEISFSAYYPTTATPEIYLGFVNSSLTDSSYNLRDEAVDSVYPNGKLDISSYSNITNNNSEILGDTVFNIKLSTPVKITEKYAVLIVKTNQMFKIYGLESPASTNPLLNTYWNASMSRIISSDNTSLLMLTRYKTSTSNLNQTDVTGKLLNENLIHTSNGFTFNNATFVDNILSITVENPSASLSDVQIYKVNTTTTALSKTFVTSSFTIEILEDKINLALNKNISLGKYVVKFKIGSNYFYKSFEVVESTANYPTHTISYNLNDGTNNSQNLSEYSESLKELKIYHPTKTGYEFEGWYLDSAFNTKLSGTDYSDSHGNYTLYNENLTIDLTLFAKWELMTPTILTHPSNITKTYTGTSSTLYCSATHPLGNVTYQWYKDGIIIEGQTNSSLKVTNVTDSGKYKCKITYSTKSIETNEVTVTIFKATYNLSWNYSSNFTYDNTFKTVDINKSYSDLVYTISNNQQTNAGQYTSYITFTGWNKNYNTPTLNNLNWEIKPANLEVFINDASVSNMQEFSNFDDYSYTLNGTIYDDYNLNLNFSTINTENEYIKIIDASYTPNLNYNVIINTAFLKIAKQTLTTQINNTNISAYNELGFVTDAQLVVTKINEQDLSLTNQKFIEDKNLKVYDIYNIGVTDSTISTQNTISLQISTQLAEKNLQVYMITENGMQLLNSSINGNTLSFTTDNFGQFVIVEAPIEEDIVPILISIGLILVATLFCCFIVLRIRKNRNKKYYSTTDSIPH